MPMSEEVPKVSHRRGEPLGEQACHSHGKEVLEAGGHGQQNDAPCSPAHGARSGGIPGTGQSHGSRLRNGPALGNGSRGRKPSA
jgi:hypothetical protein